MSAFSHSNLTFWRPSLLIRYSRWKNYPVWSQQHSPARYIKHGVRKSINFLCIFPVLLFNISQVLNLLLREHWGERKKLFASISRDESQIYGVTSENSYLRHSCVTILCVPNAPNANMADHSVIARDEFHESEASEALVFCFDNTLPLKSLASWTV